MLLRYIAILLVITIGLQPAVAVASLSTEPMTSADAAAFFDTMLDRQMADEHVVGATVSVVKERIAETCMKPRMTRRIVCDNVTPAKEVLPPCQRQSGSCLQLQRLVPRTSCY
jgi:hypothetical protein